MFRLGLGKLYSVTGDLGRTLQTSQLSGCKTTFDGIQILYYGVSWPVLSPNKLKSIVPRRLVKRSLKDSRVITVGGWVGRWVSW